MQPTLSWRTCCGFATKDVAAHLTQPAALFRLGRNILCNASLGIVLGAQPHAVLAIAASAALATLIQDVVLQLLVTLEANTAKKTHTKHDWKILVVIGMLRHIPQLLLNTTNFPLITLQAMHAWWVKKTFSAQELQEYCYSFSIVTV